MLPACLLLRQDPRVVQSVPCSMRVSRFLRCSTGNHLNLATTITTEGRRHNLLPPELSKQTQSTHPMCEVLKRAPQASLHWAPICKHQTLPIHLKTANSSPGITICCNWKVAKVKSNRP